MIDVDLCLNSVFGSATGGGLVVVLARLYLQRVANKIDKCDALIRIHAIKIAKLEAKTQGTSD